MTLKVGIAGAGLVGRLLALECLRRDWEVTLFDHDVSIGESSCGFVAAGMIAPYSELESSEPLIFHLGQEAIRIWPDVLQQLTHPVDLQIFGTLLISHPQDREDLFRFQKVIQHKLAEIFPQQTPAFIQKVARARLEQLAPGLSSIMHEGYWIPDEGHINSHQFFQASTETLYPRVRWHEKVKVQSVTPNQIKLTNSTHSFDLACDCRGLGAKPNWPQLRGIRGEVIWLHAPYVGLTCPVRLMHPRYPIYISPRANHIYVVGATSIESEDKSPITVQSTLELLSAAYTTHPGFAEARMIRTLTQCRPAFANHLPKIFYSDGLLKINGLYRHGYMIGPAVVREAINLILNGKTQYLELLANTEELACNL